MAEDLTPRNLRSRGGPGEGPKARAGRVSGQPEGLTYAQAGVDVATAEGFVQRLKELVAATRSPQVLADVGPFASLFRLEGHNRPVLVASVDGVGTKVKLAALLGRYEGLGHDLVNHCVNDIATCGAQPLFFLDYISGCDLTPEAKVALVKGMAEACLAVGLALVGGETAEMPGVYASGDFDLAGFIVGVVEEDAIIDGRAIQEGDLLLGLPSSGLHTNGYSLIRQLFGVGLGGDLPEERRRLDIYYPQLGATLGEALLAPHRCYYRDLKPLLSGVGAGQEPPLLKGIAHITGGGIPGNLPRILSPGLAARLDPGSGKGPPTAWEPWPGRGGYQRRLRREPARGWPSGGPGGGAGGVEARVCQRMGNGLTVGAQLAAPLLRLCIR